MNQIPMVIFVCEHGAAKSVIAAAYYNKLVRDRNFNTHAIARGTNPDAELSPKTIAGLREDGIVPTESKPQQLSLIDLESAKHIVTFCELPEEYQNTITIERWDDIPPVSENYEKARDAILARLNLLMNTK